MSITEWIGTARGRWTAKVAIVGLVALLLTAAATLGTGNDLKFFGLDLIAAGDTTDADRVVITGPDGRELPNYATGRSGESSIPTEPVEPEGPSAADLGVDEMDVRIVWWNETADNAPDGLTVGFKELPETWSPDSSERVMRQTMGPLEIGQPLTLIVRPDGSQGRTIRVPVALDWWMIPASERDAVHVEVGDDYVRVVGNAVENFDNTYRR